MNEVQNRFDYFNNKLLLVLRKVGVEFSFTETDEAKRYYYDKYKDNYYATEALIEAEVMIQWDNIVDFGKSWTKSLTDELRRYMNIESIEYNEYDNKTRLVLSDTF